MSERPNPEADKSDWRRWARRTRAKLADPERDAAVVAGIRAHPGYRRADDVLLYLPFGSEIDLTALLDDAKRFHLTRTRPDRPDLGLHPYDPRALERHRHGYRQPRDGAPDTAPASIDLALVPGLIFDRSGHRLGYGGGYFDRLLPTLRPDIDRLGVVLDALVVPVLPAAPHDIVMTHLATESGVHPVPLVTAAPGS